MVVEPPAHLDCVALGERGVVGVLHGGEGVVVLALAGEGGVLSKAGLIRLGVVQPGAACSGLTIETAAASDQPSVLDRDWLRLSTLVQSLLHWNRLFPWREKVTTSPTIPALTPACPGRPCVGASVTVRVTIRCAVQISNVLQSIIKGAGVTSQNLKYHPPLFLAIIAVTNGKTNE